MTPRNLVLPYSRPVECTDRDAPFVLDGVLYDESDLDLEEHYTDTHGYTEINFAAFAMVGMRFCPRIRGLHRQRIYCADPARDHGVLEPALRRGRHGPVGVTDSFMVLCVRHVCAFPQSGECFSAVG